MKNEKKRVERICLGCHTNFNFLPRTDGNPQRVKCYKCEPRPLFQKHIKADEPKKKKKAKVK